MRAGRIGTLVATISVAAGLLSAVPVGSQVGDVDECGEIPLAPGAPAAPIMGTEDADIIGGTPGDDLIFGLGGGDIICGRGGNDIIIGGDGDDVLYGGQGTDRVEGGAGHDQIEGGGGPDHLLGGAGLDVISGGPGDDLLRGGAGRDLLRGGRGSDRLIGGAGADTLRGQGGPDELAGSGGADALSGGGSHDVMRGGRGDDDLQGGRGRDQLFGNGGADDLAGGGGRDTCAGGAGVDVERECELGSLRTPSDFTVTPGDCAPSVFGGTCRLRLEVTNHHRGSYVRSDGAPQNELPALGETFVSVFHAICDPTVRPDPLYPHDPYIEKWFVTGFDSDVPDPDGFRARCGAGPTFVNVGVDGAPVGRIDWEVSAGPGDWCAWTFAERGIHRSKLDDRNIWTRDDQLVAYSGYAGPVCFSVTDELEFIPDQDFGDSGDVGRDSWKLEAPTGIAVEVVGTDDLPASADVVVSFQNNVAGDLVGGGWPTEPSPGARWIWGYVRDCDHDDWDPESMQLDQIPPCYFGDESGEPRLTVSAEPNPLGVGDATASLVLETGRDVCLFVHVEEYEADGDSSSELIRQRYSQPLCLQVQQDGGIMYRD